jgi:hypothetical protein
MKQHLRSTIEIIMLAFREILMKIISESWRSINALFLTSFKVILLLLLLKFIRFQKRHKYLFLLFYLFLILTWFKHESPVHLIDFFLRTHSINHHTSISPHHYIITLISTSNHSNTFFSWNKFERRIKNSIIVQFIDVVLFDFWNVRNFIIFKHRDHFKYLKLNYHLK